MKQKGNAILPMILGIIGILIAVILVSNLALPTVFAPVSDTSATVTNSTAINNITASGNYSQVILSQPDTAATATVTLTYATRGGDHINVTTTTGTFIAQVNATTVSPFTFTYSQATFVTGANQFNYSTNGSLVNNNITAISVYYNVLPQSTQSGWDSGTRATWLIVAIALVAMLVIFIFDRRF